MVHMQGAHAKSPASPPGFDFKAYDCGMSGRLQIAGGLLTALRHDFEADLLALHQRAHTGALHRGDVHEHILRAIVRLNEAEAFLGIEKLHSSDRHQEFLSRFLLNARTLIARAVTSQVLDFT
jgi:hypothetical protein